jgi:hypothetical protein
MSSLVISGDTSGQVTLAAPAVAGSNTLTLQAATGTMSVNTLGTVNAGGANPFNNTLTFIDFTGIPSWVKRITVMFQGVSLSATANILVQLGTGGTPTYTTSGYLSTFNSINQVSGTGGSNSTAGFGVRTIAAASIFSGHMTLTNISGNIWVSSHYGKIDTGNVVLGGGDVTLGDVLTAVRIKSTSTDTFDAGSINILYEG